MKKKFLTIFIGIGFCWLAQAQTITVNSPSAGNEWCVGSDHTITWTPSGPMQATVAIRLRLAGSPESAAAVLAIADGTANDGAFPWTIPNSVAPGSYFIRVRTDDSTVIGDSPAFTIKSCPASITVTSPTTSNDWCLGSDHTITWTALGAMQATVAIRLRLAGSPESAAAVQAIADGTANDGALPWTIPNSVAPGSYFIRVRTDDSTVIGDSPTFTIKPCPASITVTSPNGMEWTTGTAYGIHWTKSGAMQATVAIRLRNWGAAESAADALVIADGEANDGTFPWTIPNSIAPGSYFIRVRTDDSTVIGDSPAFTIKPCSASITVTSPDGMEWKTGTAFWIHWTKSGAMQATVAIRLRNWGAAESAADALVIANGEANDMAFYWMIPATVTAGDYFIRVRTDDGTGIGDSVKFHIVGSRIINRFPPERLPPPLLKFPRLEVSDINLTPNADGFGIIFSYKNVGGAALPKASEVPVKPSYRVLIDGKEMTHGFLTIPAFPAEPGWEQTGYFGGFIIFPTSALLAHMGVDSYQWNIGDSVTVHINENKVLGMDRHSLTRPLKHLALRYEYDMLCTGVTYDWKSHKATFTARLDGKIPANRNLEITWKHDNQLSKETLKITGRLYTFTYKVNPLPEHDSSIWLSAIFRVVLLNDQERIGDIDLRNNSCYQIFRR